MKLDKYDIELFIQSFRWGHVDLRQYNLGSQDRYKLTTLLRRVNFLDEKEARCERPNGYAQAEISALKWAIAFILLTVGEKDENPIPGRPTPGSPSPNHQ